MRKLLLPILSLLIASISFQAGAQVVVEAADTLRLCPNNNYFELDTILITETANNDIQAGESGVTYSLIMPSGIKLEPFTGTVEFFPGGDFSNTSISVNPDSAVITYSISGGSNGSQNSILIRGLRVRSSTPSLALDSILRGGTATHTGNAPGVQDHGQIGSGVLISSVTTTATDITCNGDGDGQLSVNVTGGNSPFQYSIDFGITYPYSSSPITSLGSGGYLVTVRDSYGCIANSSNVAIIDEPDPISENSPIKKNVSCNGDNDGYIIASADGGTGTINYSISGVGGPYSFASGDTALNLGAGVYDIYFQDANGCTFDGTDVTITEPTAIVNTGASSTDPTSGGGIDGQIVFGSVSGGTSPYVYSINAGSTFQTSGTFNNLGAGNYFLIINDANGCADTIGPLALNDPGTISPGGISFNGEPDTTVCSGANFSIVIQSDSAETAGGTQFQWQISSNGVSWTDIGSATSASYTIPGPHTSVRYYRRRTRKGSETAFSNSVQRLINSGNAINITIPSPLVCFEANNQIISASPAPSGSQTGVFSINPGPGLINNNNGTASFDPSAAGINVHTVYYTFTNEFGCQSIDSANVEVTTNTGVTISIPFTNYVTTDGAQTLTGTPSGGTFSGPGVVGSQFRPNLADTGLNRLYYTQFDVNGCQGVDSVDVTVVAAGTGGSISGNTSPYCNDEPSVVLTGNPEIGGTPIGFIDQGLFLQSTSSTTAILNPAAAPPGFYTVQYQYLIGFSIITVNSSVEIKAVPAVNITPSSATYCLNDGSVTLNGFPTSGAVTDFVGPGLISEAGSSAIFDPGTAGQGLKQILYIYEDNFGCNDTAFANLTVNPIPNPSITFSQSGDYCANDPADTLTGFPVPDGITSFGVFTGDNLTNQGLGIGIFTPNNTVLGPRTFTYEFTNSFGCTNSVDSSRSVNLVPTVNLDGLDVDYCANGSPDILSGSANTPGFGYYRGKTTGNIAIDSLSGVLDVTVLAPDNSYTFEYVFESSNGCSSIDSASTFINALPAVSVFPSSAGDTSLCIDGNQITIEGSPSPLSNDNTSFKGVQGLLNNNTALFNPQVVGIGDHDVWYIFTEDHTANNCTDSAMVTIRVNDLPQVGFVFADYNTGDTLSDLRFCANEDSILILSNRDTGFFSSPNSVFISNLFNGQAYMRPQATIQQLSSGSKLIRFTYTDSVGCTNTSSQNVFINNLPSNLGITSTPTAIFENPTVRFCSEDQPVNVFSTFSTKFFNDGTGEYKMIPPPPSGSLGGLLGNLTDDTVVFSPDLPSGTSYIVRYIFTDTITTCIDSIDRNVIIEAEPDLGVKIYGSNLPNGTLINSVNPDTVELCINGDSIYFIGAKDIFGTEATYGESIFDNVTDPNSVGTSIRPIINDSVYVFFPQSTNITGIHNMEFGFESVTGCVDRFDFYINMLDTPELDITLDPTVLTVTGNDPEICKSVDSLFVWPTSNLLGNGLISLNGLPVIPTETLSDTVFGQVNDTLFIIKPNEISSTVLNPLNYNISYTFIEKVSGINCRNTVNQSLRVNPLPRLTNNSFTLPSTFCEYDTIITIQGNGGINNFDSGFFKGPGIVNLSNDVASFDPSVISPAFTDQGTSDSILYTVFNTFGCEDSLYKMFTVYPKPDIEFTIQDTTNTKIDFCKEDASVYVINERQPGGVLAGSITRRFLNGGATNGNTFIPLTLPDGDNILEVVLETTNGGCTDTALQQIFVYNDPIPDFTVDGYCISDPIGFFDASTPNDTLITPSPIVSWSWVLAPGFSDTVQNPVLDYADPSLNLGQDEYTIQLEVINDVGCDKTITRNIFFGAPPVAKFNYNDFCEDIDIVFSNSSTNTDSVGSGDFKWRLSNFPFDQANLLDTFINNGSFNYQFNDPGAYSMQLDLTTSYGCSDDTLVRIDIRPVIDLSNGNVYNSDFENDSIEWRPGSLGSNNVTWAQANPAGVRMNSGPNGSSGKVWITNPSGNYSAQEKSFVEGPCFDFSRVRRPMIVFDYFSDLAVNDGVVLQYSRNRGLSWQTVGLEETGLQWFNETSIAGNPGNQALGQVGWSKQNSGWLEGRHELDTLRNNPPIGSNKPFVRLRFALGSSNANVGSREGFALANLQIRERDKLTLIEHFTNSSDPNARQGDLDHNALLNTRRNKYDVLDIQYHTDFPNADPINLDNSLEQGARSLFYGVSTIPRTVFEGNVFNNATSTWVANSNFLDNGKHREIAYRILQDASFDIDLNISKTNTDITGTATFRVNKALNPGKEYTAFIAVIEKFIPTDLPQGGTVLQGVEFKSVFKKFLPQASGTNINNVSNPGDSRSINFSWNYDNVYNPDSIYVVAFIQDNVTREIYQVATDDSTTVWVPNAIDDNLAGASPVEFRLYPNPSKGTSILQFEGVAQSGEILTIHDQLGHKITEEEIIPGTKNILINLQDYPSGVYIVNVAHPVYGRKTSRLVITK